jgi:peroxiredoxin Q/BCP
MNIDSASTIGLNTEAPDFALKNEKGEEWRLSEHRGRIVALLFYPEDETLVCTKQMCAVRDNWSKYLATGAEIIGISKGTVESHKRFADHHHLPLPLLADTEGEVTKIYNGDWWLPTWFTRTLVVVDAAGIIRCHKVMLKVFRPNDNQVLTAIRLAQYDKLTERSAECSR